jgi:hypothetical protein
VTAVPRVPHERFTCFWSTGTGWGTFSTGAGLEIKVLHGTLPCRSCEFIGSGVAATVDGKAVAHKVEHAGARVVVRFEEPLVIAAGSVLRIHA